MEIFPVYATRWQEDVGYEETGDLIGYQAVDKHGTVLAFGESRNEATENALEALWPIECEFNSHHSA